MGGGRPRTASTSSKQPLSLQSVSWREPLTAVDCLSTDADDAAGREQRGRRDGAAGSKQQAAATADRCRRRRTVSVPRRLSTSGCQQRIKNSCQAPACGALQTANAVDSTVQAEQPSRAARSSLSAICALCPPPRTMQQRKRDQRQELQTGKFASRQPAAPASRSRAVPDRAVAAARSLGAPPPLLLCRRCCNSGHLVSQHPPPLPTPCNTQQ